MIIVFSIFIALYLPSVATNAGLFDLAEYRRVSYEASIGKDFLWFASDLNLPALTPHNIDHFVKKFVENIPDESHPNYLFVTSKGGSKFACSLPDVEDLKKPASSGSSKNPKIYGDALAESFDVDRCIKLRGNHWWGYILCRGQTVEQVHGEPGEEGYVKNILGLFDGSLTMPSYQETTEDRLLYVEESYSSGTFCDLENYREPRSTVVRYECDPQLSIDEAVVSSVAEVKPCQYLMIVKVGSLCDFPEFLPASQANKMDIGCQPYLSKKEVRGLLEEKINELNRKALEAKRKVAMAQEKLKRASDRRVAMTKSARSQNQQDEMKKINAEMDYNAAYFNIIAAKLEEQGEFTVRALNYRWESYTDVYNEDGLPDVMFNADYDSIADENRAHLWYYFNDPLWPKDYFPKDILSTAVQNAYIEEVTVNLQSSYDYDHDRRGVVEGITEFLKTGVIELETNAVIPAMDVYDEIIATNKEFAEYRYMWLRDLYRIFRDERNEFIVVDKILDSIRHPPKDMKYFPLGNMAKATISLVLDDVWTDLNEISQNGPSSKIFIVESHESKRLYNGIDVKPYPENMKKRNENVKYILKTVEEKTGYDVEIEYLTILAPLYQLLSISWFHRNNPNYFNVSPVSGAHLKEVGSEDYEFHKNLVRDMAYFARILTYSTLTRMGEFEGWQNGKDGKLHTAEALETYYMHNTLELDDGLIELTESILFEKFGPQAVSSAKKKRLNKKMTRYKTIYWVKDQYSRRQAQNLEGLMKDLHSVKDDALASAKNNQKFDGYFQRNKWYEFESIDYMDIDGLEDFSEYLWSPTLDENFFGEDEVDAALELVEKRYKEIEKSYKKRHWEDVEILDDDDDYFL